MSTTDNAALRNRRGALRLLGFHGMGAAAASVAAFAASTAASAQQRPPSSLRELALRRRSVRRYSDQPISRETLQAMLETALLAPTSWGREVVEFVVVEGRERLFELAQCKSIGAPSIAQAAAAVVVIADMSSAEFWIEDASVAATYLLLAAEEQGLGACWNHIRNRSGRRDAAQEEIKALLGIPARYAVLCMVSLGHKGEKKSPRSEADIPKANIHYGVF